jgi:hypothetical protein
MYEKKRQEEKHTQSTVRMTITRCLNSNSRLNFIDSLFCVYCSHTVRWRGGFTQPSATTTHAKTTVSKRWYYKTSVSAVQLIRKLMLHWNGSRMLKATFSPTTTSSPTLNLRTVHTKTEKLLVIQLIQKSKQRPQINSSQSNNLIYRVSTKNFKLSEWYRKQMRRS